MARRTRRYPGNLSEQIAAAWRHRLKLRTDPPALPAVVAVLASFAAQHLPRDTRPFPRVALRRAGQGLATVRDAVAASDLRGLVAACAALNAPAFDALADIGAFVGILHGMNEPSHGSRVIRQSVASRIGLAAMLVVLNKPPSGRPKRGRAHVVARVVLFYFEQMWFDQECQDFLALQRMRVEQTGVTLDTQQAVLAPLAEELERLRAVRTLLSLRPWQRERGEWFNEQRQYVLTPLVADVFRILGIPGVARSVVAEVMAQRRRSASKSR